MELRDGGVVLGLLNAEAEAANTPVPAPAGWVTVEGNRLLQGGAPVVLKGLNYYPAAGPWSYMWTAWDGPQVERELGRARRELGINVVRVLLPYRKLEGWTDGEGNVAPHMLARLREMVQLAGRQQIKPDHHAVRLGRPARRSRQYPRSCPPALSPYRGRRVCRRRPHSGLGSA